MASQEDLKDLQRHSAIQDARISNLETKFEMFMQSIKDSNDKRAAEMKDFKDEMRGRDDRRAEEIAELRNTFQTIQNTLLAMQARNRNQNVLVIIGVIAIAFAVFLK